MNQLSKETLIEKEYLAKTIDYIKETLTTENTEIADKEDDLIAYRKEMYENASHSSQDFSKLAETVQYLNPLTMKTMDYEAAKQRIALYQKLEQKPYFARVDFSAHDWGMETIYIGIGNLENEDTFENYVYDWRAPISSIFYRFELGAANYTAPAGIIEGDITLKRQFEIDQGELNYFFDSSVNIVDDILKEALSKNTSPKMRTIVETIQREQDIIIRDVESDLLIVQGVAGSGKTSIALHRAAYLMYEGLAGHLKASNMILISPNNLFARYIADVLPELGEENITTVTFEKLFFLHYGEDINFDKRNYMLESILVAPAEERTLLQSSLVFKNSPDFLELINRLITYYERHLIEFSDVMYGGKTIAKKELLKARVIGSNGHSMPIQVRLNHVETLIRDQIKAARPQRLKVLEDFVANMPGRAFDFKTEARLLNTKQLSAIMKNVRKFTRIDYTGLYGKLFNSKALFDKLAKGLNLPENIHEILEYTRIRLESGNICYSDAMALLLIKLKTDSNTEDIAIRQVVVDEVQDYSAVHFEILARLFPNAKYTLLGDINQTIVGTGKEDIYGSAQKIFAKKKSTQVSLNKSFRCSYEISTFASQFSAKEIELEQLDRHEEPPVLVHKETTERLDEALLKQLVLWQESGQKTIAIVCKNAREARAVYKRIAHRLEVSLFSDDEVAPVSGTIILPVYLAKGLEFDAVLVYEPNDEAYNNEDDKRLLYIASTRALHRLGLFYTGKLSRLITKTE